MSHGGGAGRDVDGCIRRQGQAASSGASGEARLSLHLVQPEPAAGEAYTMALGPRAAHSEASGIWLSSILDRKMMGVAFGFLCRLFTESSSSVAVTDKDTFDLSTSFDSNKALQHDRDELPEQRSVGGGLDVPLRPVGFGG